MFRVNKQGKSRLQWDKVADSGTRSAFNTGSQRDSQEGKGRYDLIPTSVLHRLAVHYENGAAKYGDNNWQKGQPLNQYYNSAMRHLQAIKDGKLDEDHFSAAMWDIAAMIHHIDAIYDGVLPESLDSFGFINKIKEAETVQQLKEYVDTPTYTQPFVSTWIPVIASGVPLYDNHIEPTYDPDVVIAKIHQTDKKVWDKDRFTSRRTTKLDPEELG